VRRPATLERAFWNLHSRTWDDFLAEPAVVDHIDEVATLLAGSTPAGGVVVDLGCGTGNYAVALADRGLRVVALDFAGGMLARAASKARGRRVSLVRADLGHPLPLADSSVDGVLSVFAAQFLDIDRFVAEVRRVLTASGAFLLEMPSQTTPRQPLPDMPATHRLFQHGKRMVVRGGVALRLARLHRDNEVGHALERHGFAVVDRRDHGRGYTFLARVP